MGNAALRCCSSTRPAQAHEEDGDEESRDVGTNRVQLASSELFSLPALATAYHTSVLVNGEEFFFSDSGIFSDRALMSHQGSPSELLDLGLSRRTGSQLLNAMESYFRPGTYDLIRKNCNSFSDCAVHYLLGKRLDRKYSALERVGQRANVELIQRFTKGMYQPNSAASNFSCDDVISQIDRMDEKDDCAKAPRPSRAALMAGARVTVIGLKSAESFNGLGATVYRYNGVNGRWEARLDTGEIKAFRAENLRPAGELALQAGDVCRIHSLKTDAGKAMNERRGEIVRYLHEVNRYEIRIGSELKALKAENLQHLPDVRKEDGAL